MNCTEKKLLGSWELESWTATNQDGDTFQPMQGCVGRLMYSGSRRKHVSVQISSPNRSQHVSESFFDSGEHEASKSFMGYLAYTGSFSVDINSMELFHVIEMSMFPNWVGVTRRSQITLSENQSRLKIVTELPKTGIHTLIWRRPD